MANSTRSFRSHARLEGGGDPTRSPLCGTRTPERRTRAVLRRGRAALRRRGNRPTSRRPGAGAGLVAAALFVGAGMGTAPSGLWAAVSPAQTQSQADPGAPGGGETTGAPGMVDPAAFGLPAPDGVRDVEVVAITDSTQAERLSEGLPLKPERLLRMTVTEGSWMSVDVSPDGSTVVFDLLGSIWTVPLDGGEATPLTRGMAFDAQPRFSPDGERIVFTSDRSGGENVWMLSTDLADTTRLTRGEQNAYQSPTFSPDGEYVVVTRQGGGGQGKLRLYHVDGGTGVDLISEPANLRTTGAAFTPDGEEIWYARRTGSWSYNSSMSEYQLSVYDRDSGETRTESNRYGGAVRPTLSPDGRWLVYATRHLEHTGLRIREVDTDEERWLAYPVQRDKQESRATRDAYPGMAFTPDSREVVATYGGGIWRIPVNGGEPIPVSFEAAVEQPMGPEVDFDYPVEDDPEFVVKQIRDGVPSPEGDRVAFSALGRIYVKELSDGDPVRLTDHPGNQHAPVWSPDGAHIAYVNWDFQEGGHLWRVAATGGEPRRLTEHEAYYRQPAWSPDGERVVALRGPARAYVEALTQGVPLGSRDVVWVPAEGGEIGVVTEVNGFANPHFTRDPERIYAYGAVRGLISFRWDGTDERTHLQVTGPSAPGGTGSPPASLVLMGPEGNRALAQHGMDLYTLHVPRVGGDGPTVDVSNPDNAAFPVRKLTDIGGQFPAWGHDGEKVHWSIGNAHVIYDLEDARAFEDSLEAERAREEAEDPVDEPGDDADAPGDPDADEPPADADDDDDDEEEPRYRPREIRVEVAAERDRPHGTVLLRGARLVTMAGDEVIEAGDLLIRDNRIAAVGEEGTVEVPDGTRVMELSGYTVVPGFIDTHAHLRAPFEIHRDQPWSYAANLAYGVTTTRDPQTGSTDVLSYEDMVRAGRTLGPRIYSTGPGVFSREGIQSLDDARDVLKRYAEYYDTKTIKMYGAGNRATRQHIIEAARELELMPTTEGALDMGLNVTMGVDGYSGMEHNMPGFPLYGDVVQLVANSRMAYTPTILVTYGGPWAENYYYVTENVMGDEKLLSFTPVEEVQRKALRRNAGWFHASQHTMPLVSHFVEQVIDAGGRVGVGSHGQLQGLGYHWELWATAKGGMSEHDALRAATILGAESLGLSGDLGSLEEGKLADLVVLRDNPLEDLRNSNTLRYVMMNGRLHDGDTLDEVWPVERRVGPFYWQEFEVVEPAPEAGIGR